ncbi:HTTM domain-containing protein [bacterium]|nr:HTTM domain-containing protein [bacterium]
MMALRASSFDYFFLKTKSVFTLDLRSLAFFRILLSLVLIYDLFDRIRDLKDHYTDWGVLPRQVLIDSIANFWEWSLHFSFGHTFGVFILFGLSLASYICLLVGYRTRLSTIISWVLLTSLQTRNPMVLQGGDELLKMVLFWAIFLPTGACFSLDRPQNVMKNKFCSAATVGLIVQLLILYIFAGLYKLAERQWIGGEALFLALSSVDLNTEISRGILKYHDFLRWGAYFTLL